jgi:hypothetical protein
LFEKPEDIEIPNSVGAHGGGDEALLVDLFGEQGAEINKDMRAASHINGALSILTGVCANNSIATGRQTVKVSVVFIV